MKRDSTTIWIESPNTITAISWIENSPDFSGFREPALSILKAAYDAGKDDIEVIPDSTLEPLILPPYWDGLLNRLLSGDLRSLFVAITFAAISSPAIFLARQDIYGALSNPAIADRISALRAGLDILQSSGYQMPDGDRTLWNNAIADLNFPDSLRL